MKNKMTILLLSTSLLAFAQHSNSENCPEVHVESISELNVSESVKRNNNKVEDHSSSEFKNYIKVTGCGCETKLIEFEKQDSQSKIAEQLATEFKHSCNAGEVEIKEFRKVVKKKKSWFRRVLGLKAKTKTKESYFILL